MRSCFSGSEFGVVSRRDASASEVVGITIEDCCRSAEDWEKGR